MLGLPTDASTEAIRQAFRKLAKREHPDTATGQAGQMVRLNLAYETLRDPARRRAYDRVLSPGGAVADHRDGAARRPAPPRPSGPPAPDPYAFLAQVFAPQDRRLVATLDALETAYRDLAYDVYDDAFVAAFAGAVQRARAAIDRISARLHDGAWPAPFGAALLRYTQALRQVEDALADYVDFTTSLDADRLVQGHAVLAEGLELFAEAREAFPPL